MKKVIRTVLVAALILAMMFTCASVAFADVPNITFTEGLDIMPVIAPAPASVEDQLAATEITARSALVKAKSGKPALQINFTVNGDIKLDGIEVFRSTKRGVFGKTPIFTTSNSSYLNTSVKVGTRYYYKARGYVVVDGKKEYTGFSKMAYRMVKANPTAKAAKIEPLYVEEPAIAGGFVPAKDKTVTDELRAMFDEAAAKWDGLAGVPKELVATQVVAGTNYKFLVACGLNGGNEEKYIIIHKGLDGVASVLREEPIESTGAFVPAEDKTVTAELKAMFDAAAAKWNGIAGTPVELVATQVVAGTNYKFLVEYTVNGAKAQKYVIINKGLDGAASVLREEVL